MPDQKKIRYGGQTIDLPAGMTLEEAKAQMARFFPELSEPHVETKKDGDTTTYVFSKQAGRKGADSLRCTICGEIKWTAHSHQCDPRWQYCLDGDGDEWQDVYAEDEEKAAQKAAEKEWNTDYRDEITIWIRKPDELTATKYPVDVDFDPVFNARHVGKSVKRETRQLPEPEEL